MGNWDMHKLRLKGTGKRRKENMLDSDKSVGGSSRDSSDRQVFGGGSRMKSFGMRSRGIPRSISYRNSEADGARPLPGVAEEDRGNIGDVGAYEKDHAESACDDISTGEFSKTHNYYCGGLECFQLSCWKCRGVEQAHEKQYMRTEEARPTCLKRQLRVTVNKSETRNCDMHKLRLKVKGRRRKENILVGDKGVGDSSRDCSDGQVFWGEQNEIVQLPAKKDAEVLFFPQI